MHAKNCTCMRSAYPYFVPVPRLSQCCNIFFFQMDQKRLIGIITAGAAAQYGSKKISKLWHPITLWRAVEFNCCSTWNSSTRKITQFNNWCSPTKWFSYHNQSRVNVRIFVRTFLGIILKVCAAILVKSSLSHETLHASNNASFILQSSPILTHRRHRPHYGATAKKFWHTSNLDH